MRDACGFWKQWILKVAHSVDAQCFIQSIMPYLSLKTLKSKAKMYKKDDRLSGWFVSSFSPLNPPIFQVR